MTAAMQDPFAQVMPAGTVAFVGFAVAHREISTVSQLRRENVSVAAACEFGRTAGPALIRELAKSFRFDARERRDYGGWPTR
jgi:hypothetical protein